MRIKALGLAALFLGLGLAAAAQRGPGGFRGAGGERGDRLAERLADRVGERDILGRLTAALELNASQVADAQELLDRRDAATDAISEQGRGSRQTLNELIEAGDDPTAIGEAVLAPRALRQQFQDANRTFTDAFTNLLTATQQEQFESIQAMRPGYLEGAGFGRLGRRGASLRAVR